MAIGGQQAQLQDTRATITLKGSAETVKEFFGYAVNTILYQRGIYPPESFTRVSKYGMTMLVSSDKGIIDYLDAVLDQAADWLQQGQVEKLVVVVKGTGQDEKVLERWVFEVETDAEVLQSKGETTRKKAEKETVGEIQALIRQITASVTFLPLLDEPCSFEILAYTRKESEVPSEWEESDPHYIVNQHQVTLRSFDTAVHKVNAMVAFAAEDEELI